MKQLSCKIPPESEEEGKRKVCCSTELNISGLLDMIIKLCIIKWPTYLTLQMNTVKQQQIHHEIFCFLHLFGKKDAAWRRPGRRARPRRPAGPQRVLPCSPSSYVSASGRGSKHFPRLQMHAHVQSGTCVQGPFKLPANPLQRRKIKEHLSSSFLMQI